MDLGFIVPFFFGAYNSKPSCLFYKLDTVECFCLQLLNRDAYIILRLVEDLMLSHVCCSFQFSMEMVGAKYGKIEKSYAANMVGAKYGTLDGKEE
ncbi:hypothetical protein Bca4012_010438 [Brassica carinata]